MAEISKELKSEVLTYWRDTRKDKDALARTADLFGLREEEVQRIIAVCRNEKFVWTDERVHRLKAYISLGMKNAEIAKQLGCKAQAVADFKKNHKAELCNAECKGQNAELAEGKCRVRSCVVARNEEISIDAGVKNEPTVAGTTVDSEKKIDITKVNSSGNDYNTDSEKCQDPNTLSGYVSVERYLELDRVLSDIYEYVSEASALLAALSAASGVWCEKTAYGEGGRYLEYYRILCDKAYAALTEAEKLILEV